MSDHFLQRRQSQVGLDCPIFAGQFFCTSGLFVRVQQSNVIWKVGTFVICNIWKGTLAPIPLLVGEYNGSSFEIWIFDRLLVVGV